MGGPLCLSGCCGEEKNHSPLPGIEPQFLVKLACSLVITPTELLWLYPRKVWLKVNLFCLKFLSQWQRFYIYGSGHGIF
jgi:hypothetical protein